MRNSWRPPLWFDKPVGRVVFPVDLRDTGVVRLGVQATRVVRVPRVILCSLVRRVIWRPERVGGVPLPFGGDIEVSIAQNSPANRYSRTKIKYLHLQYIDGFDYSTRGGFPYLMTVHSSHEHFHLLNKSKVNSPTDVQPWWQNPTDSCTNSSDTASCLKTFFAGSTANDVLIFSVGLSYAFNLPNKAIDIHAWLKDSTVHFKRNLDSIFKGHVFRVSLSQTTKRDAFHTPLLQEVDAQLYELWKPGAGSVSADTRDWHHIDQWAINKDRDHLYADRLHFPGNLSLATVHQVLNTLCPVGV